MTFIKVIALFFSAAILLSGCGSHNPELVGKWVEVGKRISQWDVSRVDEKEARRFEFFADGHGFMKVGEKEESFSWSSSSHKLKFKFKLSEDEDYEYNIRQGKLSLINQVGIEFEFNKQ